MSLRKLRVFNGVIVSRIVWLIFPLWQCNNYHASHPRVSSNDTVVISGARRKMTLVTASLWWALRVCDLGMGQTPVEIENQIGGLIWNIRLQSIDAQLTVFDDVVGKGAVPARPADGACDLRFRSPAPAR